MFVTKNYKRSHWPTKLLQEFYQGIFNNYMQVRIIIIIMVTDKHNHYFVVPLLISPVQETNAHYLHLLNVISTLIIIKNFDGKTAFQEQCLRALRTAVDIMSFRVLYISLLMQNVIHKLITVWRENSQSYFWGITVYIMSFRIVIMLSVHQSLK